MNKDKIILENGDYLNEEIPTQKTKQIKEHTKKKEGKCLPWSSILEKYYFLLISSETVSFFLPLALLRAKSFLPLAVDILSRNPCLFLLFLIDG